jgi:hypothetical protein
MSARTRRMVVLLALLALVGASVVVSVTGGLGR